VALNFGAVADRLEQSNQEFASPGELAVHIEPRTIWTPALQILDDALVDAAEQVAPRLLFSMSPQEGKSERCSRNFLTWILKRNPDLRVASISASDILARRWGRTVRDDITNHPELGLRISNSSSAANEWKIVGHDGGMITSSIGGSLTGRPVDVMVIDDPFKDMQDADSETIRGHVKDWWRMVGSTRLPESGIVVVVQTRWHQDDLIGWLKSEDDHDWRHINIPAQADHDPDKDQVDILGREPGEYMVSARGRTVPGWERRKKDAGSRGWAALYQGNPAPAEGGIFKRTWWQFASFDRGIRKSDGTMEAPGLDQVMISVDATFKDTKASDFVVMQVWGKRGAQAILLDQVRGRWDFPTTCTQLESLSAKWPQASLKLIEDKANGPAIIAQLRNRVPGMVAFTPVDSKEARANAIAAFVEAGNVELPNPAVHLWVNDFVEECAAFGAGAAHDDMVDTMTQALHRLLLGSRLSTFVDQLKAGG
jgi:predicted phage terminase large subunit-like protein